MRANLDGQLTCDFAHWLEQWQTPVFIGDSFKGYCGQANLAQLVGQLGAGSQVQITEQQVLRPEAGKVLGYGFLYLHNQCGDRIQSLGVITQAHSLRLIIGISVTAELASTALQINLMAELHQFTTGIGDQGNPALQYLAFFNHANFHLSPVAASAASF